MKWALFTKGLGELQNSVLSGFSSEDSIRELAILYSILPNNAVALRARAWIETLVFISYLPPPYVALRARAWIETYLHR